MIWLGEAFARQVHAQYGGFTDDYFVERVAFYTRCRSLMNLGERFAGESEAPLELLLTQLGWAFRASH